MEIVTESAATLAWLGDAVYTLFVRDLLIKKGFQKISHLQKLQNKYNSANGQAEILEKLENQSFFNEEESVILRRGFNAAVHTKAKNADLMTYKKATSLEALIGYLYLYDHQERMNQLLKKIGEIGESL